jgi:hypothetical protein
MLETTRHSIKMAQSMSKMAQNMLETTRHSIKMAQSMSKMAHGICHFNEIAHLGNCFSQVLAKPSS